MQIAVTAAIDSCYSKVVHKWEYMSFLNILEAQRGYHNFKNCTHFTRSFHKTVYGSSGSSHRTTNWAKDKIVSTSKYQDLRIVNTTFYAVLFSVLDRGERWAYVSTRIQLKMHTALTTTL